MQKFTDGINVCYLDDSVDASKYLDGSIFRLMTDDEIDKHENPEKYLNDEEKLLVYRQNMPTLSPIEFDLLLDKFELYDAVQDLIADNKTLKIAYTRATFFSRLSPFIIEASELLGLTPEQVDAMWTTPQ